MKWSNEQIEELKALCMAGTPNQKLAERFGVPLTEIHAKRSQLGITIPKCKAAMGKPPIAPNQDFEKALPSTPALEGMEIFYNAGEICIVLERKGDTALIVRPANRCTPYVVPLQHKPGASDWWQGKYFSNLAAAWDYYQGSVV